MPSLDKLERRLGFLGIPGFMRIIVGFNALVFLLLRLNPGFRSVLELDRSGADSPWRSLAVDHLYFSPANR